MNIKFIQESLKKVLIFAKLVIGLNLQISFLFAETKVMQKYTTKFQKVNIVFIHASSEAAGTWFCLKYWFLWVFNSSISLKEREKKREREREREREKSERERKRYVKEKKAEQKRNWGKESRT